MKDMTELCDEIPFREWPDRIEPDLTWWTTGMPDPMYYRRVPITMRNIAFLAQHIARAMKGVSE
uniref:Uncharacterized protein n=1 Tax=viral metagenome TaxID=1070528 RepID=A0A6H1ZZF1_9ZZZZ